MTLKEELHSKCTDIIRERISTAEKAMAASHESMLGETKSSAGDKFETARAMLQGEQDRMKGMLIKNKEMAYQLSQVPLDQHNQIHSGSLVKTGTHSYFIAVGLGKVSMGETHYYVISLASPLGQLLQGKKSGNHVVINGRTISIEEVT